MNNNLKSCSRCGLPETYETIEFDEYGVCNICLQHNFKVNSIDFSGRLSELKKMADSHRGTGDYDCIVPFSGGKDSTFTLWYVVTQLKLKPLVVQFNHGFLRAKLVANNERTLKKLGVDFLSFTPNWRVVKLLMKESLIRKGDFCWHCHTGIFSYPMHVAIKYKIPLVLWGEPSSEYTAYLDYRNDEIEKVDEVRFNQMTNLGLTARDMAEILEGTAEFDPRDLSPYSYPPRKDLEDLGYKSVALGSYIPWDTKSQSALISEELGWEGDQVEGMPPGLYDYEKIECYMQGSRDYIKYLKRGYGRVTQMTALDLRSGRMNKEDAEKLVEEFEGKRPASLDLLLEYLEMSESEFEEVISEMAVYPNKPFFETIKVGSPTHDFKNWYREK
jgi:N-acetyl sugar amidotransferase